MKNISVEVVFINNDNKIIQKNHNLIEEKYFKIIYEYAKYINAIIIK